MLKKYGKAIEQPQGTLPLHLHSEQMDGQSTVKEEAGGKSPCAEWSLALPPKGRGLPSTHSHVFSLDPTPPIHGIWAAEKGRATVTGGSSKQKVKGTGATPPGTVSCVCSWQPRLWIEKLGGPGAGCRPPHTSLPATSPPSRLSAELAPRS